MIIDTLLASAEHCGDRLAVADPKGALDYGSLVSMACVMRDQVEKCATSQNVGLMFPSSCSFAGCFYGILWAGRTAVPLNFLLQPVELAGVIDDAELDVIFTTKLFSKLVEPLKVKSIFVEDLPLKQETAEQLAGGTPALPIVDLDDTAVLLYTSGTSGKPKGVCQTYGNLLADMNASIEKAKLVSEHVFLGILPLFHSFGLTAMLLVPVALGASVHYVPRFNPNAVLQAIREYRISVTMMIASMFGALLRAKEGGPDDLASIQYAISGGEALSLTVYEQFKERFHIEILQGYGMTEASPVVSLNVPWSNRVGTVGRPIPGVTARAFDDDGNPLPAGEIGELWIQGPNIMKGYYRNEPESRAVLTSDGWYKTGDMAMLDEEGYITITGRKKEMIIVGGENVFPREIECILEEHPAVKEAAVIGRSDPSRGEVVVAVVTLLDHRQATEIELRQFCRERIAGYKQPRRIIITEDVPRGPTGKILKRCLGELL